MTTYYVYRSAKTGRYVSKAFAERNLASTVREKITK
jgi:hypothetical protein